MATALDDDKIYWFEKIGLTFQPHVLWESESDEGFYGVAAVDVDEDGAIDVVVAALNADEVRLYENDGSQSFTERVIDDTSGAPRDVWVGDVDADGDLDVLTAAVACDCVRFHKNDGAQSFSTTTEGSLTGAYVIDAADFDGDGNFDALAGAGATAGNDALAVYLNDGFSVWSWSELVVLTSADYAFDVHAADLDGDGFVDALAASRTSSSTPDHTVAWHRSANLLYFEEIVIADDLTDARVAIAEDLDGDNDLDVLAAAPLTWFPQTCLDGPHCSSVAFTDRVLSSSSTTACDVLAADVDGDGDVDVVASACSNGVYQYFVGEVFWLQNDGSQSFSHHTVQDTTQRPYSVYAVDLDLDGDLDILAATPLDDSITFFENDEGGAFSTNVLSTTVEDVLSVIAVDVDNDGYVDVVSGGEDGTVAWRGARVFERRGRRLASPVAARVGR